jgi:hypothetical protein
MPETINAVRSFEAAGYTACGKFMERPADLPDTSVSTRSCLPTGWHYPDPGIGVLASRSLPRLLAPRSL